MIAVIEDVSERRRLEDVRRDFVANVSHELKTPMGAVGLLAETLLSENEPQVAQRLAHRIYNEAFRISRVIDDLLDLSRIENEESPPREPVLINLVMAEAAERVREAASQLQIEVTLEEPSPPVVVLGDRRQLTSAVYNLLENAVKFSPRKAGSAASAARRRGGRGGRRRPRHRHSVRATSSGSSSASTVLTRAVAARQAERASASLSFGTWPLTIEAASRSSLGREKGRPSL